MLVKKQHKVFYISVSPVREYQHPSFVAEEIDDIYCLYTIIASLSYGNRGSKSCTQAYNQTQIAVTSIKVLIRFNFSHSRWNSFVKVKTKRKKINKQIQYKLSFPFIFLLF